MAKDKLANWDAQLAAEAEAAAKMEQNTGGGGRFSIRGGVLKYEDVPVENNQMAVIIVDSVMLNAFYSDAYDPDSTSSPDCFAIGRDESVLAPHEESEDPQHEKCQGCPQNQFGTSDKGKGKACGNRRRLALLPAGDLTAQGKLSLETDPEAYLSARIGTLAVPPTSLKGWGGYVKQVANNLKLPPHGIVTKIALVPDPKSQQLLTFQPLQQLPKNLIGAIMKRRDEAKALLEQPFPKNEVEEKPKGKGKGAGKKARY